MALLHVGGVVVELRGGLALRQEHGQTSAGCRAVPRPLGLASKSLRLWKTNDNKAIKYVYMYGDELYKPATDFIW
jgi:hypothetical protein